MRKRETVLTGVVLAALLAAVAAGPIGQAGPALSPRAAAPAVPGYCAPTGGLIGHVCLILG
jgi:hypothetical protein